MHLHRSDALLGTAVSLLLLLAAVPGDAAAKDDTSREAELRLTQIVEGGEAGSGHLETFTVPAAPGESATRGIQPGEVLGEQRVLVTLVNFTNDPSTPFLVTDAETDILDETNPASAASYVLEVSYGRAWLSGSVQGWLSASYADPSCLVRTQSGTQKLIDDLDPSIDFSLVDRWIIVIPQNLSCGFLGISSLGKWTFSSDEGSVRFSRVILNSPSLPWGSIVAHELGHSFAGLQHSVDLECGAAVVGPGCTELGTDRYDAMGGIFPGGHFAPPGKHALEWLDTEQVDVTGPGGTFLLEPYETVGTGTKVLRIPASGYRNDYSELNDYWVSYRKPLGFDAPFTELATDGAMLHQGTRYFPEFAPDAIGPSRLLDAKPGTGSQIPDTEDVLLEAGQTFVDTERGITIETLGMVGGSLEVQVSIDQYCGNGVRDAGIGEVCDGSDVGVETCASLGFTSGTLACSASCGFDTSSCGPAVCAPGDSFDPGAGLCTASILTSAPVHMSIYRNWATWSDGRHIPFGTLLTENRGAFGANQNFSEGTRAIIWRMLLPFDTSGLPDGATLEAATLRLTHDLYWDAYTNSHPESADQLVLVQTNDPEPTVRALLDFGAFSPIDAPPEGAPRIDVSDTWVSHGEFVFQLDATGLSWIDDTGFSLLGLRTAFDVDDVSIAAPEEVDFSIAFVPPDSPIAGPRLTVTYHPLPEPGASAGIVSGVVLLGWLARRRGSRG